MKRCKKLPAHLRTGIRSIQDMTSDLILTIVPKKLLRMATITVTVELKDGSRYGDTTYHVHMSLQAEKRLKALLARPKRMGKAAAEEFNQKFEKDMGRK